MINGNFTQNITSTTDIARAFNNSYDGVFIMALLFFLFIMLAIFVYSWNGDGLGSLLFSGSIITLISFLLSLTRDSLGTQLLSFEKFIFWLVITALLFVARKIID